MSEDDFMKAMEEAIVNTPPSAIVSSKTLRIWYNTLLEYKDGQVKVIKSYSTVAKESDVKKATSPKKGPKPKQEEIKFEVQKSNKEIF